MGAIAVAPSDAERDLRRHGGVVPARGPDLRHRRLSLHGRGQHAGSISDSPETHQITDVVVDPRDADRVFVSAIGHAFGPNPERGVFRTTDGGKNWKKVLFIDDSTGANDIAMDPSNPRILYASMYKFQRTPWSMLAGGGRSGIWKSVDGGDTWTEISKAPGIPKGPLGKIGLDVSRVEPAADLRLHRGPRLHRRLLPLRRRGRDTGSG